jgi:hypothetical protein
MKRFDLCGQRHKARRPASNGKYSRSGQKSQNPFPFLRERSLKKNQVNDVFLKRKSLYIRVEWETGC